MDESIWDDLDDLKFVDENRAVAAMLDPAPLSTSDRKAIVREAMALVNRN